MAKDLEVPKIIWVLNLYSWPHSSQVKTKQFEDQERSAVQEIACQERAHYTTFAACLKPLLVEQVAMLREVEQLDGVMDKLNQIIADPFNKLSSSEEIVSFVKVRQ